MKKENVLETAKIPQLIRKYLLPAIGKAKEGIFLSLSRQAFLQLPLIFIVSYFFQMNGVLFADSTADGLA